MEEDEQNQENQYLEGPSEITDLETMEAETVRGETVMEEADIT